MTIDSTGDTAGDSTGASPGELADAVVRAEVRDELPDDLDVTQFVGVYQFPSVLRRRIAGLILAAFAIGCGVAARASDNEGLVAAAVVFALLAAYHLLASWPLKIDQTDALARASSAVGFPVGHSSARVMFRGLRARPAWQVLLYSADEPPSIRGLVELDAVSGAVIGEYTENNPEDWSQYGLTQNESSS